MVLPAPDVGAPSLERCQDHLKMTKLFQLKRRKEETWVEYQTTTSIMARKIWEQMGLPFLCEKLQKVFGQPWRGCAMKKRML